MSERIDVYDGKYSVVLNDDHTLSFLRYGEPWEAAERNYGKFDNLISAMAHEISSLREQVSRLTPTINPDGD